MENFKLKKPKEKDLLEFLSDYSNKLCESWILVSDQIYEEMLSNFSNKRADFFSDSITIYLDNTKLYKIKFTQVNEISLNWIFISYISSEKINYKNRFETPKRIFFID